MNLAISQASAETLAAIAAWRYEPPYDFYDGDEEPAKNPERYFEARDEDGTLIGFYYFERRADELEYGLGVRPDLTGRGLGLDFVLAGLEFARQRFAPERIVLNVAAFNDRARIVYERAGFRLSGRHVRNFTRWGDVDFLEMEEVP